MNKIVLKAQQSEITEYHIYLNLAKKIKDKHNRKILLRVAQDELKHYNFWKSVTKQELRPGQGMMYWYLFLATIFGLSFTLKLMEKGEDFSQRNYEKLMPHFPQVKQIQHDEHMHEEHILSLLNEDRIAYASSLVLGLNDALVELTGALAGLTLALGNSQLVALSGIVIGFAASLSMAASGYLSAKEENNQMKKPLKAAFYTGGAYVITVVLLVLPYFIFSNIYVSLAVMLGVALLVILGYTFYITTAKSLKFWRRFLEMALISLTVAVVSFGVGYLLRMFLGVEV
ncbi:MAG: VIT1/CCC1 transporter family protein [Nanoarchaeota archaeon]|nr:VIT1/CCC1 transporter family protein [Nanoarchaeota archaeon]